MRNPFVVGLLAGGRQFADREAEVGRMARAFAEPGHRLVVYGDARLGKSSALERAAETARQRGTPVAIASLATASDPAEAAQRVLTAVQRALGAGAWDVIEQIAQRLRLPLELAPSPAVGGAPTLRFRFPAQSSTNAQHLLPAVLDAIALALSERGLAIGLGLDEFQRICDWGGEAVEWQLRESLARQQAVGYVLVGSRRAQIEALVTDPARAFWQLADVLAFGPIAAEPLARWITEQGTRTGVTIPLDASRLIVRLTRGRTRDVVQLARAVWFDIYTRGAIDPYLLVQEAFERTVREHGALYEGLWGRLGAREQAVLRAFAADADIQIMAAESNLRFRLGPKSSVYSAVERLVDAEHLTRVCPGRYAFDDPFFRRYVQVNGLPDIGEATPQPLPARPSPTAQAGAVATTPASRYSSTSAAL